MRSFDECSFRASRWRLAVAASFVLVTAAVTGTTHAQSVLARDGTELFCDVPELRPCATDAGCGPGELCRRFGTTTAGQCFPRDTVFCCSSDADCPPAAPGADGLRATSLEQVGRCHTRPDGTLTIAWSEGDCDEDGLTNDFEQSTIVTDVCRAPRPSSFFVGGECEDAAISCTLGERCEWANGGATTACTIDPSGTGTICLPPDRSYRCCGTMADSCPGDATCIELAEAPLCVPRLCAGSPFVSDLERCVRGVDGLLVPFSLGDCDGDDIPNGSDDTPCGSEDPEADAGAPDRDAGAPAVDGGAATMDGGTTGVMPGFHGGGGVTCRAAPGAGRGRGGLTVALLALLALAARRR